MPIGPRCSTEREGGKEGGGRGIKKVVFAEAPLRCEGLGLSHVTVSDGALAYRWIGKEVLK